MPTEIIVIIALVLVNGVLAGAEIALIAVRPQRLRELAEQGSGAAKAALALREKPERFFATVQVGITVVGATASAFGGATLAEDLALVLRNVPLIAGVADEVALVVVVTLISYLSLVLGELVPKSLAMKFAETYALLIARPLRGLATLFRPLIWFLTASSNLVLKPFKDRTSFTETRLSVEELVQLVDEATDAGTVNKRAGDIAARALELPTLVASDVMVPRTSVVGLARDSTVSQLRALLLEHTHSRFPVYDGELDRVVGYLATKDVINLAWDEHLIVLDDLIRPAFFVPPNKNAVELLSEMRSRRVPFAIVVDEHGGMNGIVTLEDVVEELVGEIFTEHDRTPTEHFARDADGTITVKGATSLRELNRALDLKLSEDGAWVTIAGLVLALAKRIPAPGARVQAGPGIELEVLEATDRGVDSVRIHFVAGEEKSP